MHSCLYEGWVKHRRFQPGRHEFRYRLFMMYLDLDELPALFDAYWLWSARGFNLAWFKREDHMPPYEDTLLGSVRRFLRDHGHSSEGPVRLLTHLRYFGYGFNPVSFYYCFNREDTRVEHIVAEVSNTPWRERHYYLLSAEANAGDERNMRFDHDKAFHVSPFMPMSMRYGWRLSEPGEKLFVHIENYQDDARVFDAIMGLKRKPITHRNLASVLLRYPAMTFQVVYGIYWQALKLWLKKTPLYSHPNPKEAPGRANEL